MSKKYKVKNIKDAIECFKHTHEIIELAGEYSLESAACPTIYGFEDKQGNDFYFRYRDGYMSLNKNGKILHSKKVGEEYDGVCDWTYFCIIAFSVGYLILDTNTDKPSWIESDEVDILLKNTR